MIDLPPEPPPLVRPAIVAPAAREVSFGDVRGRVASGTTRVAVTVDGEQVASVPVSGGRFRVDVALPRRDVSVRVTAFDAAGRNASRVVRHVFGLPAAARAVPLAGTEDGPLARRVRRLARSFPGTAAVFVQDLVTGEGAAWNARARFPAASTLKLAVAIETLRVLRGRPAGDSFVGSRFRRMLVASDNRAANELLVWLGGSTTGGSAQVTATMRALRVYDSRMSGGYATAAAARRPIPLRVERQPVFVGKYTTAADLARLHRDVHLAATGRGRLLRLRGAFTAADARFLLYMLASVRDRGKLDRFVRRPGVAVPHKAGWMLSVRHDSGIVYWRRGAFVAAVMTWSGTGVGREADVLAGRVARAALRRFRPAVGAGEATAGALLFRL